MSEVLEATEPGWRPDPSGRYEWRYWDNGWTNRVANSAKAAPVVDEAPDRTLAVDAPPPAPPVADAPPPAPPVAWFGDAPAAGGVVATSPAPGSTVATYTAPTPPAWPAVAPVPRVRTFPTSHDGSSGTVWDQPYLGDATTTAEPETRRRGVRARIAAFVRSFWEQPESYHSPKAGPDVPPHPREHELVPLPNYGRAGLVMLSAVGVAVGAYLPWISGSIDTIAFERTGYEMGHAWGFTWAAASFTVAAILGARHKVFGWVTMAMSVVVAALVSHQLLEVHDQVVGMNRGPTVDANVGIGLWIMLASAAIGLIAAFRLDAPAKMD
jgi:hypothetical protein